jgi:NADPH:quinone reductase
LKALRFEKTGDIANLAYTDIPTPTPRADEVLVRVMGAGLNKSDVSNVSGFFPYTTVPRIPGRDFAGVVEKGPALLVGKRVYGSGKEVGFTRDGSHAEFLLLPADAVSIKPESLSFAEAASCGVPFVTAWFAVENTQVKAGTKVVVIGAAGGVGIATMHLARMRGAEVVGAVRRPEQAAALASRGFAAIVLGGPESLAEGVRKHFPDGADMIFDTPGFWLKESINALAKYGRVAVIVAPGDGMASVPLRHLYRIGASIVGVNSLLYSAAESARMFDGLRDGFENGQLRAPDGLTLRPLASGKDVYAALKQGHAGKFVLVPEDSTR